jgi:RNA polymerase sigma factor (sigma-70 family)
MNKEARLGAVLAKTPRVVRPSKDMGAKDMATASTSPIARYIHRIAAANVAATASDTVLLARFIDLRDGDAFAALVRRHGSLVLAACRRVLGDQHAAEDAFQATFLTLACKAGSLSRPDALGPWLYGVACRTALKARARASRRRVCERRAALAPAVEYPDTLVWRDIRPALDEAVARLPDHYRIPFVLHHLEGATVAEIARRLGWPPGTVAVRLARGTEMLRARLTRRGLTLSACTLAAAISESTAPASVAPSLLAATVRAATASATGSGAAAAVSALAHGGGKAALMAKIVAACFLAVLGVGGACLSGQDPPADARKESGDIPKQVVKEQAREDDSTLFLGGRDRFLREEYQEAAAWFSSLVEKYPNSPFAGAAQELAGISKYISTGNKRTYGYRQSVARGRRLIRSAFEDPADGEAMGAERPWPIGETDRRVRLAFGAEDRAEQAPVKLWFRQGQMLAAADTLQFDRDGRVRLTPCRVALFSREGRASKARG